MRILIWDFDGTLGYREGLWAKAVLDVLDIHEPQHQMSTEKVRPYLQSGFPWHSPDTIHKHLGSADAWWRELQPVFDRTYTALGYEPERATQLGSCVRESYCDPRSWLLFPDTLKVLESLRHSGWSHILLSNHVPELADILSHLGLSKLFDAVFNSAETGIEKPNPQAYRDVISTFPNHEAIWMIGDSEAADVDGPELEGIPAILVRRQSKRPVRQCDDLHGVLTFINT